MTVRPLGVVSITFGTRDIAIGAVEASRLGFDHIDIPATWEGPLALPIGDRISRRPRPGCTWPAPADVGDSWDRAVARLRAEPGVRIEAGPGSILGSVERIKAFFAEVPTARLTLDTGHVACWGEDPVELVEFAAHVQLRQSQLGVPQATEGDVDFRALFRRLDAIGYDGLLSIEYFDLPELGWPLDDPVGCATSLAQQLRPLLA
jgi:sugar phosphate isomerase/epimerase